MIEKFATWSIVKKLSPHLKWSLRTLKKKTKISFNGVKEQVTSFHITFRNTKDFLGRTQVEL